MSFAFLQDMQQTALMNQDLREFGAGLEGGLSMEEAMRVVVETAQSNGIRKSFTVIGDALDEGMPIEEALAGDLARELPVWTRLLLISAAFSDRERGIMIQARVEAFQTAIRVDPELQYAVMQSAVLGMNGLAMVMFVFPQISEILVGLKFPLPPLTRFILEITGFMVNWWFLSVPLLLGMLAAGGFGAKHIMMRYLWASRERTFLLKTLEKTSPSRWPGILDVLGHATLMPAIGTEVREVAEALNQNGDPYPGLKRAGFDGITGWTLAVVCRFPARHSLVKEIFDYANDMGRLWECRFANFLHVGTTLGFGIFLGMSCLGLFLPLILMLDTM